MAAEEGSRGREKSNVKLSTVLHRLLREKDCKEAVKAVYDEKNKNYIETDGWEIIGIVSEFLTEESLREDPEFHTCCDILLQVVAETSNPKEVLIGLLEQMEESVKFKTMLKPVRIVLLRLPIEKRAKSLEWALATICDYVVAMPLPTNMSVYETEEDRLLLDADPNICSIIEIYQLLRSFFKPFVEITNQKGKVEDDVIVQNCEMLTVYLLRLLGHPLAYLDLSLNVDKPKSAVRICTEDLSAYLSSILTDVCIFLQHIRTKRVGLTPSSNNDPSGDNKVKIMDSDAEDVPLISLANYYYLLFAEELNWDRIPCVYSPIYFLTHCLFLSAVLMQDRTQTFAVRKGLLLIGALINRNKPESLSTYYLELPGHAEFMPTLTNIIVYCESRECRQLGVQLIPKYFGLFNPAGKYRLFTELFNTVKHSGLIGFVITHLKDVIVRNFGNEYFRDENLHKLIFKICHLSHGAETDFLEISEEIISTLNFIRFLAIRDKQNVTGIWTIMPRIQEEYLEQLRLGLNIARAHYELKIKEGISDEEMETTLTVGGQDMPKLTPLEKKNVLKTAITTFDFIHSLLGRVTECIEAHYANSQCN